MAVRVARDLVQPEEEADPQVQQHGPQRQRDHQRIGPV